MKLSHTIRNALLTALLGACATASAQILPAAPLPPDAGALQRSQQQQQDFLNTPAQSPQAQQPVIRDERGQDKDTLSESTARFVLKNLVFTASNYLSEAELQGIAQKHIGQEVTYADLQAILAEINTLYRDHKILTARAILPPQKVTDGTVHIELVEGKLGKINIEGNQITDTDWIKNWLDMKSDQPLDTGKLQDRIELYNHVSATQLGASLKPGETFGYTDLAIQVKEPPHYQLGVFGDNLGSPSVGRNEIGLNGAINGIFGIDDRFGVYAVHSSGSDSAAINYAVPVNHSGGRVQVSYSDLQTHVTSGPYADFNVRGNSRNAQIQLSQPLARWDEWWLDGSASGARTQSSNTLLSADLGSTTVTSFSLGLAASALYDNRSFTLSLTDAWNKMNSDTNGDRNANVWTLNSTWIEKVSDVQYTLIRVGMQQTSAALVASSVAMQLGGANTVRGYSLGAISGDKGYYSNLEWHHHLFGGVGGYFFSDWGHVSTSGVPSQTISSLGLGADASPWKNTAFNLTVAHAMKEVETDQTKTLVMVRLSWQML